MYNLIKNSCWKSGPHDGPLYFTRTDPVTYDNFCYKGDRTCSVTMKECESSRINYDLFVKLCHARCLRMALTIRAVEISNIYYVVEFYDECQRFMCKKRRNVEACVKPYFETVFEDFSIPQNARYAKIYFIFENKVTACTCCNPRLCAY